MIDLASRGTRFVPFSWFYSALMRDLIVKGDAELSPERTHEYSPHVAPNVVVLAAFVTETTVNEIAYWLHVHPTYPVAMPAAVFERHTSIRKKWRLVPQACGVPGFDETQAPWEDFNALIELRNALAHAGAYPDPPEPVLQVLEARGCTQKAADWFESVMTMRTARWARQTASAMPNALMHMLEQRVPVRTGPHPWMWGPEWLPPG